MFFFSIVIPTFNRSDKISKCLDSIVCQSFKDYEVIVCDDGSTDNTIEIIETYKNKLANLQYIKIANSGWASKPRNEAMKIATGQWVCFLDSDDYWKCNKLEKTFTAIKNNKLAEIIYHDLAVVNNEGANLFTIKGRTLTPKKEFTDLLYRGNAIPLSSSVVKMNKIKEIGFFDEVDRKFKGEDLDYWLRASLLETNFLYIPEELGYYLKHDTNTYDEAFELNVLDIPEKYTNRLNKRQLNYFKQRTRYRLGLIHFGRNRFTEAKHYFKENIFNAALSIQVKSLIRLLQVFLKEQKG